MADDLGPILPQPGDDLDAGGAGDAGMLDLSGSETTMPAQTEAGPGEEAAARQEEEEAATAGEIADPFRDTDFSRDVLDQPAAPNL